jgi:hypothetical protein
VLVDHQRHSGGRASPTLSPLLQDFWS